MDNLVIDFKNEKPLYLQLVEIIKQRVVANSWAPGMKIPSENEMTREFGLSVGTVKKALGVLVNEGILFRRQGQGTFIASSDFSRSFIRFFRYGMTGGKPSEVPGSKILDFSVVAADPEISEVLELQPGEKVYRMNRIRTLQNIPFAVEDLYLPFERFKGIDSIPLEDQLLYPIYSMEFSTPIIWADEFLQPAVTDSETASILEVDEKTPVFCIERIAHSYGDLPVEFRRSVCAGNNFKYHIEIR